MDFSVYINEGELAKQIPLLKQAWGNDQPDPV
jgi:hypothetical protein